MWKILKAELIYNKYVIIIPYSIVLTAIIANLAQGWRNIEVNIPGVKAVMASMIVVIFFFSIIKFYTEKRERYYTIFPLSVRNIGISRLLFLATIWLSFILLFWISSLSVRPYRLDYMLWDTLSLTGFILIINAYAFIQRDIYFYFQGRYKKLLVTVLYVIMIMTGYFLFYVLFLPTIPYFDFFIRFEPIKEEFSSFPSSPLGAVIFIFLGLAFSYLSVVTFIHRRTYIE